MTIFPHDQFAKDYLLELLSSLGEVETSRDIAAEVREIDICFSPSPEPKGDLPAETRRDRQILGLLGKMAMTPAIFEPFRNAVSVTAVIGCMSKLFDVLAALERQAKRKNTRINRDDLPRLWILSPTVSVPLLKGFGAKLDRENWGDGVYFLPPYFKTGIVAIHQLPATPETLWLRTLGKGRVQEQAINEIETLPQDYPFRLEVLELLGSLRAILELRQDLQQEDRKLIMRLSAIYLQRLSEATQQGIEQGIEQGIQQGQRIIVENLLKAKFGELDPELLEIIDQWLNLSSEEYTHLLLQFSNLSREELLARFKK
jgi:hypothetical protein